MNFQSNYWGIFHNHEFNMFFSIKKAPTPRRRYSADNFIILTVVACPGYTPGQTSKQSQLFVARPPDTKHVPLRRQTPASGDTTASLSDHETAVPLLQMATSVAPRFLPSQH